MVVLGKTVKTFSPRLQAFARSISCAYCGIKGEFFAVEHNSGKKSLAADRDWHLNMYAIKEGKEVLMTKDHIKPKSLGGDESPENLATCCQTCNMNKDSKELLTTCNGTKLIPCAACGSALRSDFICTNTTCPNNTMWVFERSSGYDGWRCLVCATWIYGDQERKCNCVR